MSPRASAASTCARPDISLLHTGLAFAADSENTLTDEVFLRICRVSKGDPAITPDWVATSRRVSQLVGSARQVPQMEAALALLASLLGPLRPFNPIHLPFGSNGPQLQSNGWVDRDAQESIGKQIVGLMRPHTSADAIAAGVHRAVSEAVRLGFLEQRAYDAWRPGMPSGSGWRFAVTATPYGIARALLLVESTRGQDRTAPKPPRTTRTESEDEPGAMSAPSNTADQRVDVQGVSDDGGDAEKKPYRKRLFELCEARGLSVGEPTARKDRDVQEAATRLADELDAWVEAIRDAEADRHPAGECWTMLAEDLEEMLGPAGLTTGVFEDVWTPLLTQLRMSGLSEVAEALDRLAGEVLPQAQELARDMDAVAYLRNGGPRDAFYDLYAREDLAAHEACAWQSRQDVARGVMRIVGTLRTLAKGEAGRTLAGAAMPPTRPRAWPRRGTRAANIEKLEKELEKHLLAARDHAHFLLDRGREPALLPRPSQKELARRTGLSESDVSRCRNDKRARVLKILWDTADSLDDVMMYKRRR